MQTATQFPLIEGDYANTLDKSAFVKIADHENVPVFASINAYFIAKLFLPLHREHMIREAFQALRNRNPSDPSGQKMRRLIGGKDRDFGFVLAVLDDQSLSLGFPYDF